MMWKKRTRLFIVACAAGLLIAGTSVGAVYASGASAVTASSEARTIRPTELVTTTKASVRVGIIPEESAAAINEYVADQSRLLEGYSATNPEMQVCAFVTFKSGVAQSAIDEVLNVTGMSLRYIEWELPNGTHGGSSTLGNVALSLASILDEVQKGGTKPSASLGPVDISAVSVGGIVTLRGLAALADRSDVLLADPGPVDQVLEDSTGGLTTLCRAPEALYWKLQGLVSAASS